MLNPARLVFIDETASSTNMVRLRSRCPRGERLIGSVPHGHRKTITLVVGLRHDRIVAPFVIDEAMSGSTFLTYVERCLAPTLHRGDIVIIDSLPAHKVAGVTDAIEAVFGNIPWIAAIFYGLKPAVMAIVAVAVIRIGRKALRNEIMWTLAALAFVAIFFFHIPFPVIILSAGVIGLIGGRFWKEKFDVVGSHNGPIDESVLSDAAESPEHARPSLARAIKLILIWTVLWFAPTVAVGLWRGWQSTLFQEGLFFSKAAVVTFGGAYAVLPYVAQQALFHFGWLKPGQMMDGLGLAETTPGPLIMVLQFVGFIGAWQHPEDLSPLLAGTLGALITTWATFTPCFLWIFLGGPHIEQLRGNVKLTAALSAITAAVVGVVMNLAVWFAINALFPGNGTIDWFAVVISAVAFVGMLRWKWDIIPVVVGAGALGIAGHVLGIR
jgi:chromate transporter